MTKLEQAEAFITKVEQMGRWKDSLRFYKRGLLLPTYK